MGSNYSRDIFKQLQEVIERMEKLEKEHKIEAAKLNERIVILEKENEDLHVENEKLRSDNERMKRILNNDSSNSSLPPSSDQKGKKANEYNSREKSGRKNGAQKGHNGKTLTKKDIEEKIKSGEYRHKIVHHGKPSKKYVSKYVLDFEVQVVATENRFYADENGRINIAAGNHSDVVYGSLLKTIAVALYSEGVVSNDRICDFINAFSGGKLHISEGSIYGFCQKFEQKSEKSILQIKDELLNAPVINTDATTVTTNGKMSYIRNFSTLRVVLYCALESKNIEALEKLGIPKEYCGIFVHDHETALYHFGSDHAECIAHLLRYLTKNTQETNNQWSEELKSLLNEMNSARQKMINTGETEFTKDKVAEYEAKYDELIKKGVQENIKTKGVWASKDEETLLNRLIKYKRNHLLFLNDFRVPFTNNMSERDLRKSKNRQKMSGGFRKSSGSEMYCVIMSVIETCKRRAMPSFETIRKIFDSSQPVF